jgi:hypothetical protein
VLGGLLALWRKPTTLFMSSVLGFASGVLLATVSLEMIPQALAKGSVWIAISGFLLGCSLVYGLDLFIHRGKLAGPASQQRGSVERFYHRRRPRGTEVTVLTRWLAAAAWHLAAHPCLPHRERRGWYVLSNDHKAAARGRGATLSAIRGNLRHRWIPAHSVHIGVLFETSHSPSETSREICHGSIRRSNHRRLQSNCRASAERAKRFRRHRRAVIPREREKKPFWIWRSAASGSSAAERVNALARSADVMKGAADEGYWAAGMNDHIT